MEQRDIIDMEQQDTKFYVSSVALMVAKVGMQRTVESWNHHPIAGVYIVQTVQVVLQKNVNYRLCARKR